MNRLGRVVCSLRGHVDYSTTMLPEEAFGLYAYSRIWCPRCGKTIVSRSIEDQIDVLMGYVSLWNDVRPIIQAASDYLAHDGSGIKRAGRWGGDFDAMDLTVAYAALTGAIDRYEALYPEHVRPSPSLPVKTGAT